MQFVSLQKRGERIRKSSTTMPCQQRGFDTASDVQWWNYKGFMVSTETHFLLAYSGPSLIQMGSGSN